MKKVIYAVAILITFAACKSKQTTDETKVLAAFKDSVEMAEFKKWKMEQEAKANAPVVRCSDWWCRWCCSRCRY
jgi:hypothetical protein